ncbi:hypothetical protein DRO24_03225 [Candidatus Bathyarchaeota archaeon]|nr:MAG: hypothetical protein DRO24_03225 [Candidatus Bathyarchaeota archaeon]
MAIQAVMEAERPREGLKIDIHCHISIVEYTDPRHPKIVRISREDLLSDLDAAGFDMAVILSDRRTPPEAVSQFISAAPDRLIGFGYVNP